MAHRMLKPFSLLSYLLSFVCFFFVGIAYAGWVEAGKGQMLAGGAIVLGYGVIGAFLGLLLSLILANTLLGKRIIQLNIVWAVLIVIFVIYFKVKYEMRQKQKEKEKTEQIDSQKFPKSTNPSEK